MNFTIYSTGDGAFLAEVLNAVAMLMNNGGFVIIAAIGLLLGVLMAVSTAVTNAGRSIPLGGPALALVAYMVLFVPKADVIVYDSYSMAGRPVDNIPLGVAVAGTVLSHMGYFITQQFETAYSIPGMTSTGYATPLEMLLSVRKLGLGSANSIGSSDEDNFLQTMSNYINECTETGILTGALSPSVIAESGDAWAAIEFPSGAYTTKTYLPGDGPNGQLVTCSQAYTKIDGQWGARLDAWNSYLSNHYGGTNVRTHINSALNTLMSGTGLSANDYMRNSLILDIIERVSAGNYGPDTFGAAMMVTQATEQARVQYAAEASMFAQFARPLMTFVEGFVYAIVPFMVFVIGFGIAGFKLISRYILILLWVQLWMPIMSLTNLFVQMAFMQQMDALSGVGGADPMNPMSLMGLTQLQGEAANWVAVAGNLVAATPALALTIIYGGAYTMVNLAGRINPGDMVDETQLAPSMLKNQGIMSMSARASNTPLGGTTAQGAKDVAGSFSMGTMAQQAESSAYQAQLAAQQNYAHTVTKGWGMGESGSLSRSDLRSIGNDLAVSHDTSWSQSMKSMETYSAQNNLTDQRKAELASIMAQTTATSVSGTLSAGTPGKGVFGLSGEVGAKAEMSWKDTQQTLLSHGFENTEGLKDAYDQAVSKESQDALRETLTSSAKDNTTQAWEQTAQEMNQEQYQSALSQLRSATESYNRADSLSDSVGLKKEISAVEMTEAMSNNAQLMAQYDRFLATNPTLQGAISDRVARMTSQDHPIYGDERVDQNMDRYHLHAGMEVLSQHFDDSDAREMFMSMAYGSGYVAQGTGLDDDFSASRNAAIGGDVQPRAHATVPGIQAQMRNAQREAAGAPGYIGAQRAAQDGVPTQAHFRENEMQPVRARQDQQFRSDTKDPGEFVDRQAVHSWVDGLGRDVGYSDEALQRGQKEMNDVRASVSNPSQQAEAVGNYIHDLGQYGRAHGMTDAQADWQEYVMQARGGYGGAVMDADYTMALAAEGNEWEQVNQNTGGWFSDGPYAEAKPFYERIESEYSKVYPDNPQRAAQAALDTMNLIKTNTMLGSRGVSMTANQLAPINDAAASYAEHGPSEKPQPSTPQEAAPKLSVAPTAPYQGDSAGTPIGEPTGNARPYSGQLGSTPSPGSGESSTNTGAPLDSWTVKQRDGNWDVKEGVPPVQVDEKVPPSRS